jgi:YD repeat-containing protein
MTIKNAFFLFVLSSAMVSCGGDKESNGAENGEDQSEVEEVVKKTCFLSKATFTFGDSERTMNFTYENDMLNNIVMKTEGRDDQELKFEYDGENLSSFTLDKTKGTYVYEEGRLVEITGEGSVTTRKFEYNEEGQIVKQNTIMGTRIYMTHVYEYNEAELPVKVSMMDGSGNVTEENELKYDDKRNPFVGTSGLANTMELMLGYPIGNAANNVVEIKKIYKKKTSYKINGEYKMPGDEELSKVVYEYNEDDYPISISRAKNSSESKMKLEYDCK